MNAFDKLYCDDCKADIDRLEKGYHAINPQCKKIKCRTLNMIELALFIPLMFLMTLVLAPIVFGIIIHDYFLEGDRNEKR